jgi:hypothetical protein
MVSFFGSSGIISDFVLYSDPCCLGELEGKVFDNEPMNKMRQNHFLGMRLGATQYFQTIISSYIANAAHHQPSIY